MANKDLCLMILFMDNVLIEVMLKLFGRARLKVVEVKRVKPPIQNITCCYATVAITKMEVADIWRTAGL